MAEEEEEIEPTAIKISNIDDNPDLSLKCIGM